MVTAIPRMQTEDREINQLQQNIISAVNPVLANPLSSGILLQSVPLLTGANSVNHKLGRPLTGWFVTRLRSLASIYDTQDLNPTPAVTLDLVSSADVVIDLYVF